MNNKNKFENNKVVYINNDNEEDGNNDNITNTEMIPPTNNVIYTKENTRINTDFDVDEEYENEEYEEISNQDDLLLKMKQSGYDSDGGDISDSDSVATIDILNIDPLYLRLTKFLQTKDGESVAETLQKINEQLVMLNANLKNNVQQ